MGKAHVPGSMELQKRGSHTVRDCKYPIVWGTKYRYPLIGMQE